MRFEYKKMEVKQFLANKTRKKNKAVLGKYVAC